MVATSRGSDGGREEKKVIVLMTSLSGFDDFGHRPRHPWEAGHWCRGLDHLCWFDEGLEGQREPIGRHGVCD
jgi:hypothetical protein